MAVLPEIEIVSPEMPIDPAIGGPYVICPDITSILSPEIVIIPADTSYILTDVPVDVDSEVAPIRPITLLTAFDIAFAPLIGVAGMDSSFVALADGGNAATRF